MRVQPNFKVITIYVPAGGRRWCYAHLEHILGQTFGGFTMQQSIGGWRNPASGIVEVEEVRVYRISLPNAAFNEDALRVVIDWIKKEFAQQEVLVECVDCLRYLSE